MYIQSYTVAKLQNTKLIYSPIFADKACLARPEYRLKRAWYILTKNKNKAEILKHIFTILRTKFKLNHFLCAIIIKNWHTFKGL